MGWMDESLRRRYRGGHGDLIARRLARLWAGVYARGLFGRRWVTLEVPGRRSGQPTRFPLGMADLGENWYVVSMLGERCNWVLNVRAAHGRVVLRNGRGNGRTRSCRLVEVPVDERVPVLRRYLRTVPGGRPHIPATADDPDEALAALAGRYPVFRVEPDPDR